VTDGASLIAPQANWIGAASEEPPDPGRRPSQGQLDWRAAQRMRRLKRRQLNCTTQMITAMTAKVVTDEGMAATNRSRSFAGLSVRIRGGLFRC